MWDRLRREFAHRLCLFFFFFFVHVRLTIPPRYAASKRILLAHTPLDDDIKTHVLASLAAGTVATTICAPADVLKSRIQASTAAAASGSGTSLLRVLSQGMREEGPLFLMKGWTPAWLRLT